MRRLRATTTVLIIVGLCALAPAVASAAGPALDVRTTGGTPIDTYKYIVNENNVGNPDSSDPSERPGFKPDASSSRVVHTGKVSPGNTADATLPTLPAGNYLITVRAPGYKLWGRHVTLPATSAIRIELSSDNVPAANLVAHVFEDSQSVNAAPDVPLEGGLAGFDVIVEDTVGQVTVDIDGAPLCDGQCLTDADGNVTIHNLPPGKYEVSAIPPDGEGWIQTSTFEGKFSVGAFLEEGSDGRGPEPEALVGPPGTANWFGFVKEEAFDAGAGTGTIKGTARTWEAWPPGIVPVLAGPVPEPYIALSDLGNGDEQVYTGRGSSDGTFEIPDVPAGSYQLSIWDYDLDWVIRFVTVDVNPGETVDLGDVGVWRWFGRVSGSVFTDDGAGGGTAGDGVRQPGENGIRGMDVGERWRDGSIKHGTFTDTAGNYDFPESLFSPIAKFGIMEVGFARFARTGISLVGDTAKLPDDVGGGLLAAQLTQFGHSSEVDFGKRPYDAGENGGISGIVEYGTTRNESDARLQAAEDYEPGIPGATVRVSAPGDDGEPNTNDDVLLNEVTTDSWKHPSGCDVRDFNGNSVAALAFAGPTCLEYLPVGNETKDSAFDGGYAIETMCPPDPGTPGAAASSFPCDEADEVPLPPGDYVVEAVAPDGYQVVKEEDVNTSEGDTIVPQVPPPPCVGDAHDVPADDEGPYAGESRPLCDKRLVTLNDRQNAASDFFFFTDNEVPIPGRVVGVILNDVKFEVDPANVLYGEGQGEKAPVGVYNYADRLITTVNSDENGAYEVLLPSTYTASCPTPSGVCPGMYKFVINDPGTKANPNPAYNPNIIGQTLAMDVWPGKTTYADTPVIPRNAQRCNDFTGPEIFQVSKVHMLTSATGAARSFVILGRNFGNSPSVTLGGVPINVTANTAGPNGTRQLTVAVPAANAGNGFGAAGPRQLRVTAGARSTLNGLTFHLRGTGYLPNAANVITVNPGGSIQAAINAAPVAGDTLIDVAPGNYTQNVVLNKRVKLQGRGPGGFVGTQGPPNPPTEDPLQQTQGSVIDGRYFLQNEAAWNTAVAARPFAGNQDVRGGAAVTVLGQGGAQAWTSGFPAAIDGFGITLGDGAAAGGINVNGHGRSLRVTNNILESNAGEFGGAITLGLPQATTGVADNQNDDVVIRYNRILSNGGRNKAGGIGIYNGAQNYTIADNDVCANASFEYGGGISHFGNSPSGMIRDNRIMDNSAFDEGGGILVGGELGIGGPNGNGSGRVDIERNLLEQNLSNDDGGGVEVLNALTFRIELRNNMVVNNVATDVGGGLSVDDSSNVRVVNNTVARNQTTGTAEDSDGDPHGAGLIAHPYSADFDPPGPATFPSIDMFNNVFWQNRAFTPDATAESGLVDRGVIDLEVVGSSSTFTPRWSLLTVPHGTPSGSNVIGQDPAFANPFETLVTVSPGATTGPGGALQVAIEPPLLPGDVPGNYHLTAGSPAIDRGVRCSNTAFPAPASALDPCTASAVEAPSGTGADIDGDYRPQRRLPRGLRTPWDLGADELAGTLVVLP